MYKGLPQGIKKIKLEPSLHRMHKRGPAKNDFGMDNSAELLEGGFGLYSSVNIRKNIGPVKAEFFRISLTRSGTVEMNIGLEKHLPKRDSIFFGFPGQLFSLRNASADFFTYYMLFTEKFISDVFVKKITREKFPFLTYGGTQCFGLGEENAKEIESIILKMNEEVKARKTGYAEVIRSYIYLILLHANRDYSNLLLSKQPGYSPGQRLFNSFVKLVNQHFITERKVSAYADMLHVSPDHLNRVIKSNSDKTAGELIDEMLLTEAKAHLLHSKMSIAEIAYQLEFADPSHFNKFFKKLAGITPMIFRKQSD